MPRLPKSIALSALLSTVLAAPTAAQNAPQPLPVEALLSLSSAVGGETPRWAPDGDRILLGGANLRLIRAEGGRDQRTAGVHGRQRPFPGVRRTEVVAGRAMDLLGVRPERHPGDLAPVRGERRSAPDSPGTADG